MEGIPGEARRAAIVGCLVALTGLMAFGVSVASADPNGNVTEYQQGLDASAFPDHIAAGPDGNMWFTDQACLQGAGTPCAIGRITPSGQITEFDHPAGDGNVPDDIALGADGNMWFTENGDSGDIGQITPSGHITLFTQGLNQGAYPADITLGPDGNMWFTDQGLDFVAIGRIDPAGHITEFNNVPAPLGIALGPNGNLWFTTAGRSTRSLRRGARAASRRSRGWWRETSDRAPTGTCGSPTAAITRSAT